MNKFRTTNSVLMIAAVLFMAVGIASCGKKSAKIKKSEKMTMLMANSWKLDPNATIKGTTDAVEDSTGIKAVGC